MPELLLPTGQVTWNNDKHTRPKDKTRYKGGTSGGAPVRKRKKQGGGPSPIETIKVIGSDGRIRWETRQREIRR